MEEKIHTIRTVPKYNRKIMETEATSLTNIYITVHFRGLA